MTFDLLFNLLTIICLIAICSAVIWGIHGAAKTIGLAEWLDDRIKFGWVKTVIYACPICMPTFWTFWILLACGSNFGNTPILTPILVWLGTAGLNYVIKEHLYESKVVEIKGKPVESKEFRSRISQLLDEDPLI